MLFFLSSFSGRRMTSFFAPSLFFLLSFFLVAGAVEVSKADKLLEIVANCHGSFNTNITLTDDLDFYSAWKQGLPVGTTPGGCISYSGHFDGNNHRIKNLTFDGSTPSGLFCNLVNATISNLIIDSSCSFTGEIAGALSPKASGSLSIINVVNYAVVNASKNGGGLIGQVETTSPDSSVMFRKCSNHGDVFGTTTAGGIVGNIKPKGNVTFLDCENNGTVTSLTDNSAPSFSVGGLVARMDNCGSSVVVDGCTNHGNIIMHGKESMWNYAGGVVGYVDFKSSGLSFSITDSINSGNISGFSVAGLYHSNEYELGRSFIVHNCANKGNLSGQNVYGVANLISEGNIIISLGLIDLTGLSHSICPGKQPLSSLYVHNDTSAKTEQDVRRLIYQDGQLQQCFCRVKYPTCIKDVLNEIVTENQYRKVWTRLLDLVDAIHVTVGTPINRVVSVQEGDTFELVANYSGFSFDDFYPVYRRDWSSVTSQQPIYADMDIALCHAVILSGMISGTLLREHGSSLSEIDDIEELFQNPKIALVDPSNYSLVYHLEDVITKDINVKAMEKCHVQIGEPVNGLFYVIVNASYGSISALLEYLQNPKYLVFEANDSSVVLKESTPVLGNSTVIIKKASILDIVFELNNTSKSDDVLDEMEDYVKDSEFSVGHIEVIDQGNGTFSMAVSVVEDQVDDFLDFLLSCLGKNGWSS